MSLEASSFLRCNSGHKMKEKWNKTPYLEILSLSLLLSLQEIFLIRQSGNFVSFPPAFGGPEEPSQEETHTSQTRRCLRWQRNRVFSSFSLSLLSITAMLANCSQLPISNTLWWDAYKKQNKTGFWQCFELWNARSPDLQIHCHTFRMFY